MADGVQRPRADRCNRPAGSPRERSAPQQFCRSPTHRPHPNSRGGEFAEGEIVGAVFREADRTRATVCGPIQIPACTVGGVPPRAAMMRSDQLRASSASRRCEACADAHHTPVELVQQVNGDVGVRHHAIHVPNGAVMSVGKALPPFDRNHAASQMSHIPVKTGAGLLVERSEETTAGDADPSLPRSITAAAPCPADICLCA